MRSKKWFPHCVINRGNNLWMGTKKSKIKESRREFIKFFFLGSITAWVGSAFYILTRFLSPLGSREHELPKSIHIRKDHNDIPKNSSLVFPFGYRPALLIRKKSGEFVAYFGTCTHLGCTVQYNQSSELIICACHDGIFDLNGKNIRVLLRNHWLL